MNSYEKIIYFLQGEMNTPTAFGWYHSLCLIITFTIVYLLIKRRRRVSEKKLKIVLGTYGLIALILETLKQIIWSFNYDVGTNLVTWDFQWYSFPFQLCTTPIFVSLICLFLKKGALRDSLLSYLAFITILGSITTMIIPDSCFVSDILINIHTMYLHCGSFVVSVYLLVTDEVKVNIHNVLRSIIVFLVFVTVAFSLNIFIYNLGILNDETFNMFYISPYFTSSLPVFDVIQENVPYPIFLVTYILIIMLGASLVCYLYYKITSFIQYRKITKNI